MSTSALACSGTDVRLLPTSGQSIVAPPGAALFGRPGSPPEPLSVAEA
ncbi:hypothetical protein GCM10027072_48690 [Streptomyces bullii]